MCPPGRKHRRNTGVSLGACLFFLAVGRVLLFPHDGCGGREMRVYLITKRLKYPLQRSSYDRDQVVRRSHGSLERAPYEVGTHRRCLHWHSQS